MDPTPPLSIRTEAKTPRVALVGQPNCGKSTLFNALAGYRVVASNFPGTTVNLFESGVAFGAATFNLVDLPGTYSLQPLDEAEAVSLRFLLRQSYDLIVNVVDASALGRSLDLTLQLMSLGKPMVVALNMADQALHKGIILDQKALADRLGLPVVQTVANRGQGLTELLRALDRAIRQKPSVPRPAHFNRDVEHSLSQVAAIIPKSRFPKDLPPRFLAEALLDGNTHALQELQAPDLADHETVKSHWGGIKRSHGHPPPRVLAGERHALALTLSEETSTVKRREGKRPFDLDRLLMHRVGGFIALLAIFWTYFMVVYRVGGWLEGLLGNPLTALGQSFVSSLPQGLFSAIVDGLVQGFVGGLVIVLPYLLPFLFGLALLEDFGYLPRAAFLMDGLMHKVGLHGKAVIPFLLGYACNVPAVMTCRIMERKRDRVIAAALSTFIPCSARTVVLYGLVAAFLGPTATMAVYFFNLVVIAIVGHFMARMSPSSGPGLILEIPPFRRPTFKTLALKTWLRGRGFFTLAWPLLIAGSVILAVFQVVGWDKPLNAVFSPFMTLLGLPAAVGAVLIFGILRKELALLMLAQALGVTAAGISGVLSPTQLLTLAIFVLFYIPCISTIGALWKEVGAKVTWITSIGSLALATLLALGVRGISHLSGWPG